MLSPPVLLLSLSEGFVTNISASSDSLMQRSVDALVMALSSSIIFVFFPLFLLFYSDATIDGGVQDPYGHGVNRGGGGCGRDQGASFILCGLLPTPHSFPPVEMQATPVLS